MGKYINLQKRTVGNWANFESHLLKEENIHMGWIKWINNKSFLLLKNPIINHPISPFTYLTPDDVHIPDDGLIRVNVEKIEKTAKLSKGKIYGQYDNNIAIVNSYNPIKDVDDFIYRITKDWKGEYNKTFGKELALNILSCPKSIYGIGGIGAQSFNPYSSIRDLKNLNYSIKNLLPIDFQKNNNKYLYKPIMNKNDENITYGHIKKENSNEISYNYLLIPSPEVELKMMPMQVPIVIPDANYKSNKWGLDRDILDYQLSSLLIEPFIEENIQKRITNVVLKTGEKLLKKSQFQSSIDTSGILKLSMAWCRLNKKLKITENDFLSIQNDFQEIYNEYFDFIEDVNQIGKTYRIPLTRSLMNKTSLSVNANKLLSRVKKIVSQENNIKLTKDLIINNTKDLKINEYDFDMILKELVNTGYLLHHKNYTEFELVNL